MQKTTVGRQPENKGKKAPVDENQVPATGKEDRRRIAKVIPFPGNREDKKGIDREKS